MRFGLGSVGCALTGAIVGVPAVAQDTGLAKPNLVLQQIVDGLPRDDKQMVRVLTASFKPGDKTVATPIAFRSRSMCSKGASRSSSKASLRSR